MATKYVIQGPEVDSADDRAVAVVNNALSTTASIAAGSEVQIKGKTSGAVSKDILVGDDGQILQSAYFDSVIIEAPGVNDKYDVITSTIADATTDSAVTLTNVTTGYAFKIINRTTNTVLNYKLGGTGNPNLIAENSSALGLIGAAGEEQKFTSMHLSNTSGETITYEITITGV